MAYEDDHLTAASGSEERVIQFRRMRRHGEDGEMRMAGGITRSALSRRGERQCEGE